MTRRPPAIGVNIPKIEPNQLVKYPVPGDILADAQDTFQFYDK